MENCYQCGVGTTRKSANHNWRIQGITQGGRLYCVVCWNNLLRYMHGDYIPQILVIPAPEEAPTIRALR